MSIHKLSKNLISEILYHLDFKDVLSFILTCKDYNKLKGNHIFWWNYLKENYNCKYEKDKNVKYLKKSAYWYDKIKITYNIVLPFTLYRQKIKRCYYMCNNVVWVFLAACQFYPLDKVEKCIKNGINQNYINEGFKLAASANRLDVINLLIQKGANDFNAGLHKASINNNLNIINLMIQKGADNFNDGLVTACKHNHNDLVSFFIEKGANDWERALRYSIHGRNTEMIFYFLGKNISDYNKCLAASAYRGDKELIKIFIEKGADDWNLGLIRSAGGGYIDLVKFFTIKGANNFNRALKSAVRHDHIDIVRWLIQNDIEENIKLDDVLGISSNFEENNKEILEILIKHGAKNFNHTALNCVFFGNKKLFKILIEKGANDFDAFLRCAIDKGDIDMTNLILEYKNFNIKNFIIYIKTKTNNNFMIDVLEKHL